MNVQNAQTIITQQPLHCLSQSRLLFVRPRVFRLSTFVKATNIANTYAPAVMPLAMRTNRPHRATSMNSAITIYYKMIPNAVKTSILMPTVNCLYRIITSLPGRCTMQNNLVRLAPELHRLIMRKLMLNNLNHHRQKLY